MRYRAVSGGFGRNRAVSGGVGRNRPIAYTVGIAGTLSPLAVSGGPCGPLTLDYSRRPIAQESHSIAHNIDIDLRVFLSAPRLFLVVPKRVPLVDHCPSRNDCETQSGDASKDPV